jgi:hypothetical protein
VIETVISVINEYEIAENIKYMIFNNAFSNDTYIKEILKQFGITDIKEQRRFRYFGYIINFTIKVFFGLNADAFEREIINNEEIKFEN